jgi:hypothetical protein
MAVRLTVEVKNNSDKGVFRGGRFFPPLKTTTVIVSKYQLAEIKAHTDLAVVSPRDNTQVEHSVEPDKPDVPEFACPYCEDYVGKSRQGLMAHVRQAHEELYEEFKERG